VTRSREGDVAAANMGAPGGFAGQSSIAIALSGFALGAEVVWTRLLSLLLGGPLHFFDHLAVFLVGWASAAASAHFYRGGNDANPRFF